MSDQSVKLGAELPHFLPPVAFFLRMAAADRFVFADLLQFASPGPVQRCKITVQDQPRWLTVPVFHSPAVIIKNAAIDYHQNWRHKLLLNIRNAYHDWPFFAEFIGPVSRILQGKFIHLADLNIALINYLMGIWDIQTEPVRMSGLTGQRPQDDLVIFLCEKLNAQCYIIDENNRPFVDAEVLRKNGIKPLLLDYERFLPLELNFNPEISALEFLFQHGPLARVLFSEVKNSVKGLYP